MNTSGNRAGCGCANRSAAGIPSHEALMKQINEASFAMDDVLLYLDTHPTDQEALSFYHYVTNLRREAMAQHELYYGPLLADQVTSDTYWTWLTDTWPWEGGME